jgi:hypothetical protein
MHHQTAGLRRDVMGVVQQLPRLLWLEDLPGRLQRCTDCLTRLHPSGDPEIVKDMVGVRDCCEGPATTLLPTRGMRLWHVEQFEW